MSQNAVNRQAAKRVRSQIRSCRKELDKLDGELRHSPSCYGVLDSLERADVFIGEVIEAIEEDITLDELLRSLVDTMREALRGLTVSCC